ncbi:fip motif protein family protein; fip motif famil y protein [Trichuris trichiura]|uniref:Fip motif protein family protein fip motif famil y protein n=1 Tax=Trichuris trichiura TaxID=36087 RepID=A0A077ZDS9_TRITR|nr:fip motif protein family protein; fip motif famil y protein [Trichuris trichiura]
MIKRFSFPPPTMGPRGPLAPKFANKLDIDSTAVVNGASIYELDLTNLEEHPWREPGADLTDYFNYGFTEETWNAYCERQRRLRSEFGPENANRMFFNAIPSHYGAPGFDRNKGFTPGNISAITSLAPPNYFGANFSGYAGFRMPGREEAAPSMGSYSGASRFDIPKRAPCVPVFIRAFCSDDDGRVQSYDHYGKHSDYEYRHGRSRSPGDSRSYSRHSDRRSRKHSRSPTHSRHRSRDERPRGSTQARSTRDGHSHGHSEKRVSERKDDSHDKEKSYRKKEDDGRKRWYVSMNHSSCIIIVSRSSKSRTGGRESRVKESRKSKERESKSEARESKAKERRSKREESDTREKKTEKGNDDIEDRSGKKRKKQKTSHHHSDRENDKPVS